MPASRARKGILSVAGLVIGATALAAGTVAAPAADKPIVGFITQLSQQQYFVDEANGAQKIADQLGAQLIVVDSGLDSDKVMSLASSLATQGAKAIVVVPSNTDVGPALSDIANQNHMFLVASDSPLKDSAGKPVPFVGMDNTGAGKQVGDIIVREFPKTGWDPKDTFFADIEAPFQACLDRTDTALKAFQDANPGWPAGNLVKVPYKGLIDQADDAMRATLACLAFTSDYIKDGFKATTDLDPGAIGGGAVQVAVDLINGKTVPPTTYVPTPELTIDNFKDKLNCK